MKGIGDFSRFREAVTGSLVAQLDVDSKFIPAIEAALGRNLHALVLTDADAACEIIAQLKKQKLGQAALVIPQSTGRAQQSRRKALPTDALAWATDKLTAPPSLESLVSQLLGNVAIFSDLQHALECKKREPAVAMATLAGEFISTEGIVLAAAAKCARPLFWSVKRKSPSLRRSWARSAGSAIRFPLNATKRKACSKPLRSSGANQPRPNARSTICDRNKARWSVRLLSRTTGSRS